MAGPDARLPLNIQYAPTAQSLDRGIVACSRRSGDRYLIVVANETAHRLAFNLEGLEPLEGRTLDVLNSWETLTVRDGAVRFGLPGQAAAVLVTKAKK